MSNYLIKMIISEAEAEGQGPIIPLTITQGEPEITVAFKSVGNPTVNGLQYRLSDEDGNWSDWIPYEINTEINLGDSDIQFQNTKTTLSLSENDYVYFESSGAFSTDGSIQALLNYRLTAPAYSFYKLFAGTYIYEAPSMPATKVGKCAYKQMYYGCPYMFTGPELPALEVGESAYEEMFEQCESLEELSNPKIAATKLAPYCYKSMFRGTAAWYGDIELPATNLAPYCYQQMFEASTIRIAPELPATTLARGCYKNMFSMSDLTECKNLPATTLAPYCYQEMFSNCGGLSEPPSQLPATNLVPYCYYRMFDGAMIDKAPELPATTLAESCYEGMFAYSNIPAGPELPATNLAPYCYVGMFSSCLSLKTPSQLPATTLTQGCYRDMFKDTPIKTPPELPATDLAPYCYEGMFAECYSISGAPYLPATTLAPYCYKDMFRGDWRITSMSVAFSDWNSDFGSTENWVYDLTLEGTFTGPADLPPEYGNSRIPETFKFVTN